jgi:hypothetical protein
MPRQHKMYLENINEAHERGRISDEVLKSFYEKLPSLEKAITEIGRAHV